MNKIFQDLNFWNLFVFLERDDIEPETILESKQAKTNTSTTGIISRKIIALFFLNLTWGQNISFSWNIFQDLKVALNICI
jgi:hypothetical protein